MSSSTMTMGRFGPPVEGNGDGGVSPANVEKEVSGVGLSGRVIVGRVAIRMEDGGRAKRVSLSSSLLALAITGRNTSSIPYLRRSSISPSARSFWKRASFSNFCAVCRQCWK